MSEIEHEPNGKTFSLVVDQLVGLAPERCRDCPTLRILAHRLAAKALMSAKEMVIAEAKINAGGFLDCKGLEVKSKQKSKEALSDGGILDAEVEPAFTGAIHGCKNEISNTITILMQK
jgi:hypothetical protein